MRYNEREGIARPEFPVLVLLATTGMMMMISANDLHLALCRRSSCRASRSTCWRASHRDAVRSTEAGLKYFVLGALASGMLLYGASMVYGFAGTTSFDALAQAVRRRRHGVDRPRHRHRLHRGGPGLQGLGGAVPHVDARRL